MGIELVQQVILNHAHKLKQGEVIVLIRMCLNALDKPNERGQQPNLFWAERSLLAEALGYEAGEDAGLQKVKRALAGLKAYGLIEPMNGTPHTGNRQCFRLHVGPTGGQELTSSEGQELTPSFADWGSEPDPTGGQELTPLGSIKDLPSEDLPLGQTSSVTELQTLREKLRENREKGLTIGKDFDTVRSSPANQRNRT